MWTKRLSNAYLYVGFRCHGAQGKASSPGMPRQRRARLLLPRAACLWPQPCHGCPTSSHRTESPVACQSRVELAMPAGDEPGGNRKDKRARGSGRSVGPPRKRTYTGIRKNSDPKGSVVSLLPMQVARSGCSGIPLLPCSAGLAGTSCLRLEPSEHVPPQRCLPAHFRHTDTFCRLKK